jgi:mannose-6-phosphate isomerase-like protein (cupin superfamily)
MPPKGNKAAICRTRGKVTSNEGDDMKDLASARRRYHNPQYKDYATFLKTSEETDGEYTLIEFEVGPGGGNTPHYHKTYDGLLYFESSPRRMRRESRVAEERTAFRHRVYQ